MTNYYHILSIDENASADEIKAAYKKLALKYHPDKNKGSTHAEEQFKAVNEAYQILSDPYKKEKYDLVRTYQKQTSGYRSYQTYTTPKSNSDHKPHGKRDWRKRPKYGYAPVYKIDKNYYRVQAYTIGALLIAAVLFIAGSSINNYYNEKQALEEANHKKRQVQIAEEYYQRSEYDSTFFIVKSLIREFPMEAEFSQLRKVYVEQIRSKGFQLFDSKKYAQAIFELNAVKDHSRRQDLDVWMAIGESHYALQSYQKAIHAFDYVAIREPNNVQLVMRIGDIHSALNEKEQALTQYTRAKAIFKDRQSRAYGAAFELVVKPQYLDTIYYHLFEVRGQLNYDLSNYEEATTDYNWAIFLNPENELSYRMRAECYLKTGNRYRACNDLQEAYQRGDQSALSMIRQYCGS